mmetsp:Transcript_27750/g.43313  ORF Transcript_27750/g.43313 Transcript_27750/m.43313 type:complete len:111 (-) Transcript_27750:684-1016(-)
MGFFVASFVRKGAVGITEQSGSPKTAKPGISAQVHVGLNCREEEDGAKPTKDRGAPKSHTLELYKRYGRRAQIVLRALRQAHLRQSVRRALSSHFDSANQDSEEEDTPGS